MPYDPERHLRRSIRLKDYDYSQAGAYFVTVCTHGQECLFGEIEDGIMCLNPLGLIVRACWDNLPNHYPNVELDAFTVMPNHVHGIVVLADPGVGARLPRPNESLRPDRAGEPCPYTRIVTPALGHIVAYFKYQSAKRINRLRGTAGFRVWQRNYYEHIIRSQKSLDAIRRYIEDNPIQWPFDPENPSNIRT